MSAVTYQPAPVPSRPTRDGLRKAVQRCRACDLYGPATQAVMGEGGSHPRVMLIGEQPGDREDIEGRPFVGPAGRVLGSGLERAGIAAEDAYLTNVVKHFRYKARGKRRIHQRPDRWQVTACLPWVYAELDSVKPEAVVLLGATAAQALLGSGVRIGRDRGVAIDSELAELVMVTTHPSAVVRAEDRKPAMDAFVADLRVVGRWLK